MKRLHRRDLWCWSVFNERLNIDFNSFLWTRAEGNVVIDPLPMSAHDRAHLATLGGVEWIVLTNSDHLRDARTLVEHTGAKLAGPAAERERFPIACDAWISERDPLLPWRAFEMEGSKTPGELALLLDGGTLITGDLVRAHRPASLMMLHRDQGLADEAAARESIARLAVLPHLEAVLVGDGWCLFADCHESLRALVEPASPVASPSPPRSP
ncbi:MAG TPA: MBL fold metallo-hydrolase [Polyangia bacterium]|nr:MBL fold metallo-hydrolase [Polyangia bacterium]